MCYFVFFNLTLNLYLGPPHTRAESRDHEIMRAQNKVSKGRPNTPPNSCSVVTDPQGSYEVICDPGPQPNAISVNFYSCGSSHVIK